MSLLSRFLDSLNKETSPSTKEEEARKRLAHLDRSCFDLEQKRKKLLEECDALTSDLRPFEPKQKRLCDALRVRYDATEEELYCMFRFFAKKLHPDKHNGTAEANEKFKRFHRAYIVLKKLIRDRRASG